MYKPIYDKYAAYLLSLNKKERQIEINWMKKRIEEIDNNTFDVRRYLDHPVRFWFEEYRAAIKDINIDMVSMLSP